MKKFIKLLCLGLAFVFISGCEGTDSMEDITIYTSMYPIEFVTEELYKDHADVISFYPGDVNPYEYKLSSKQIKDYSSSDLIVYNGLGDEKNYIAEMINKNKKLKIIDATAKLEYENSMDELWINPSTMLTIANNTRNGLKEYINSTIIEDEIDDNYEKLKLSLSTIDAELKSMVENAKDKNIIVTSNDLKILSKYGLEITSIDETNMTDKDLADAKALLNNKTVTYIFTKKGENESNTLKELKKKYEVKTLEIDTLNNISADNKNDNQNYITIMNQNIDNLKEELY